MYFGISGFNRSGIMVFMRIKHRIKIRISIELDIGPKSYSSDTAEEG